MRLEEVDGLIKEIENRKVIDRRPHTVDIRGRYDLSPGVVKALDHLEDRLDRYIESYYSVSPDLGNDTYVKSNTGAVKNAMRVVTALPLIAGGVGYALTRKLVKAAAFSLVTTAAARAVERRYGLLSEQLKTRGFIDYMSAIDVHLAKKNLRRVVEYENTQAARGPAVSEE